MPRYGIFLYRYPNDYNVYAYPYTSLSMIPDNIRYVLKWDVRQGLDETYARPFVSREFYLYRQNAQFITVLDNTRGWKWNRDRIIWALEYGWLTKNHLSTHTMQRFMKETMKSHYRGFIRYLHQKYDVRILNITRARTAFEIMSDMALMNISFALGPVC